MSMPFDQIPESVWETLAWFASSSNATPPDTDAVRAAVGLGLLYGRAVHWVLRRRSAQWRRVWITALGIAALKWRDEQPPKSVSDKQPDKYTTSEQLPLEGRKFTEKNAPAEFREGGKPKGKVLTALYLKKSTNWLLSGSYLTKHYGPNKDLKHRIPVGRAFAYCYTELLILRDHKTANIAKREDDG